MELLNLFPTQVGRKTLGREFTKNEIDYITNLPRRKIVGNELTVDSYIFESKELSELKSFCNDSVNELFQMTHNPQDGVTLEITNSWAAFSSFGESHHEHKHSNSFYSGVLYLNAKDDKISFVRPHRLDPLFIQPNENGFTHYNSETWWLPAETGTLLMFPSMFIHGVPMVEKDHTRISIAFNTFPKGQIGRDLTTLHL